jgi:hypothetical protein
MLTIDIPQKHKIITSTINTLQIQKWHKILTLFGINVTCSNRSFVKQCLNAILIAEAVDGRTQ